MSNVKNLIMGNTVVFFADIKGSRVILLKAKFESKNDMPRLYMLAKEELQGLLQLLGKAA